MEKGDVAGIGLSIVAWIFFAIVIMLFVLSCMYYLGGPKH
jgi:hypothetical protein